MEDLRQIRPHVAVRGLALRGGELPRYRVPIGSTDRRMQSPVGLLHDEAQLAILAVGRQAEIGERLVGAVVPGADLWIRRASSPVATLRPSSFAIRTTCSTCCTEVIRTPLRLHMLSSMPTRMWMPSATDIAAYGATVRHRDS